MGGRDFARRFIPTVLRRRRRCFQSFWWARNIGCEKTSVNIVLGGGPFNSGPGFVFNLGGGPGVRVHQFGGNRPRRRPQAGGAQEQPQTATSALTSLLPLLLLVILPLLSSLFSSDSSASAKTPPFSVDVPTLSKTQQHISSNLRVPYYVKPADVADYTNARAWKDLDRVVEHYLVGRLRQDCDSEVQIRERMYDDAHGWFFVDHEKLEAARRMEMRSCERLQSLGVPYR